MPAGLNRPSMIVSVASPSTLGPRTLRTAAVTADAMTTMRRAHSGRSRPRRRRTDCLKLADFSVGTPADIHRPAAARLRRREVDLGLLLVGEDVGAIVDGAHAALRSPIWLCTISA